MMRRGVVQSHGAVRRSLHRHNRIVVMLMEVRDVRRILFVLFARFRIVLFLFAFSFPLHTNGDSNAADCNERHGDGENGDECNLTAAEIFRAADLRFLIARSRRLMESIPCSLIAIDALEAFGTLTFEAIDTIKARCTVFAWR